MKVLAALLLCLWSTSLFAQVYIALKDLSDPQDAQGFVPFAVMR